MTQQAWEGGKKGRCPKGRRGTQENTQCGFKKGRMLAVAALTAIY